jgi:hypothetical protein
MAERASQKADFCIEIDFQKGTENPSRIFKTMTEMIEAFQLLDIDLVKSIHPEIAPVAIIEDVEAGSLRTYLAYLLRSTDDDALKNLEFRLEEDSWKLFSQSEIYHSFVFYQFTRLRRAVNLQ